MNRYLTIIIIVLIGLFSLSSNSHSTIVIEGKGAFFGLFSLQVNDCLKQLIAMGEPFAGYISVLKASKNKHVIQMKNGSPNENISNDPQKERYNPNATAGVGTGTTIRWDPFNNSKYPGTQIARDPCASLLHELFHAYASETGTTNTKNLNGVVAFEIDAVCAENYYRFKKGLPQRDSYGGSPIPKDCIFK